MIFSAKLKDSSQLKLIKKLCRIIHSQGTDYFLNSIL